MYKYITPFFILAILFGCNNDNPVITHQIHTYSKEDIQNDNPFLSIDDEGNAMIFYGQDTLSMSGYGKTDGIYDLLMLKKYNRNGDVLIEETNIVKTNAIIDYAILKKNNLFYVIWLDPRNNPKFIANVDDVENHTYDVDIYYKIIDSQGKIIKEDTRLTESLIYYKNARSDYILSEIYNGTLSSIKTSSSYKIDGNGYSPNITWVIIDNNNYEHHIKTYGNHMFDSCKVTYTKLNQDSAVVLNEISIAKFVKKDGYQWGPDIQNLFFQYASQNTIYLCWQLNDGNNYFVYYNAIIYTNEHRIILNRVGVKYPTRT